MKKKKKSKFLGKMHCIGAIGGYRGKGPNFEKFRTTITPEAGYQIPNNLCGLIRFIIVKDPPADFSISRKSKKVIQI